ncbi:NAD(P)H-binding protein [Virgibacillus byunsanensis]|uniref:NAD(P)H-binding protein n=1 Tax=Virgibacillus byunsanensis TaxID=570945 RepID=A0ABW3LN93_9BACI
MPYFENQGVKIVLADLEDNFKKAFYKVDTVVFASGSGPNTGADKTIIIDQEGAIESVNLAKKIGVNRFVMLSMLGQIILKPHLSCTLSLCQAPCR